MEKIKVLHIVRPAEGGMKEHLISLVKNIDTRKFQMMVACPVDSSMYNELKIAGIEVFPINITGELNLSSDWQTIGQLKQLINKLRPDIVHTHSSKAGLVGRIAAKMTGVPIIFFTAHNSIFYDHMSKKKKLFYAYVEKFLASFTDIIIAVSGALKAEILQWEKISADKIIVIQNGINISRFQKPVDKDALCKELGIDSKKPIIGTVARFAPQKGIGYLLEAAARIKEKQVQFLIVGDGPLRPELEEQVKTLGIDNKVFFAGMRNDIDRLLPILDLFVLPSITEGLPLTILEAMAAKRPIIASAVGGIPEAIIDKKTGLLVPSRDSNALASAINQLLEDKNFALVLADNGLQLVEQNFNINCMVEKISELYISIITKKRIKH